MIVGAIRLWVQGAGNHQIAAPFLFFCTTVAVIANEDAVVLSASFLFQQRSKQSSGFQFLRDGEWFIMFFSLLLQWNRFGIPVFMIDSLMR